MNRDIGLHVYETGETIFERKSCDKCAHVSASRPPRPQICLNKGAIEYWNSETTDKTRCPYWSPEYRKLNESERRLMDELGYDRPDIHSRIISTLKRWYERTLPAARR